MKMSSIGQRILIFSIILLIGNARSDGSRALSDELPLVFPIPQEMTIGTDHFILGPEVPILVPEKPAKGDLFLARFLQAEVSDRYGIGLLIKPVSRVPMSRRFILMGDITNPLVVHISKELGLGVTARPPGREGYSVYADGSLVVVAGSDGSGAFYGLQSIRRMITREGGQILIRNAKIRDWPHKSLRGIRLYLPVQENIAFFQRFLRNFMALYKYNTLILELNSAIRLERHPEMNAGWIEFAKSLGYSRRSRPLGPGEQFQNSAHYDTGDGGVLEKSQVAAIVEYARKHHIEVIPEVPTLTHSYYWLTRHRDLAEIPNAEWPDTYCTRHPETYALVFDVLDEIIEVTKPRVLSIGHDEYRIPVDVCPRCRGANRGDLFGEDVMKLHSFLAQRGIRTAIWGDHLIERNRGKGVRHYDLPSGYSYDLPGALSPEQVEKWIPKDTLIFNWFWQEGGKNNRGEVNEVQLSEWGFEQVYGNLTPNVKHYGRRSARKEILGGFPSSWTATNEFNFGKDSVYDFLGCASLLWSSSWSDSPELNLLAQKLIPEVRRNLSGKAQPSQDGNAVNIVDIASHLGTAPAEDLGTLNLDEIKRGEISAGNLRFRLGGDGAGRRAVIVRTGGDQKNSLQTMAKGIPLYDDPSSLIFLHAAAKPAEREPSYRYIYNFEDTADLLGWYEVIFEDGFVETVPVRYGVNILEWNWGRNPDRQNTAYEAVLVDCSTPGSGPITFFAFEWKNPRFGKTIQEINLKGSRGFKNTRQQTIQTNAIILTAISAVKRREAPSLDRPLTN